jgi:hypothetical protein
VELVHPVSTPLETVTPPVDNKVVSTNVRTTVVPDSTKEEDTSPLEDLVARTVVSKTVETTTGGLKVLDNKVSNKEELVSLKVPKVKT